MIWSFNILEEDEKIYIEFDARVIGEPCSVDVNWVDVSGEAFCDWIVEDRDSATVKIEGMCMEKQVWNEKDGKWAEQTTVPQGEDVRFRITLYYYGDYKLYNIKIMDVLPDCLDYANNAIPEEPEISGDGKTLWWNLSEDYDLYDGDSLIVEFDATATEFNCEDPAVNWAYVVADECSGQELTDEDSATVIVICGLTADAGGPYAGEINQDITLTGSATGGSPPYIYEWDLDEDGEYDDAIGSEVDWQWETPGTKTVWLKVTDDNDDEDTAYALVEVILENDPPNKPSISGKKSDLVPNQKYYYELKAVDPDADQVYFYVEWGDGEVKDWFGPYDSAEIVTVNHSWSDPSTTFTIRVTAKDIYDAESQPATLTVSTPKYKQYNFPILERLGQHFKIIQKILNLLETLLNF